MIIRDLSEIVHELDLDAALVVASRGSKLLPPRPDEKTGGETAQRFTEALRHRIQTETYEPAGSFVVSVPKTGLVTRPATLMTLEDQTIYQAVVAVIAPRIAPRQLGPEVVFAHRAVGEARPWPEFEQEPLRHATAYIVRTDVFGFYENIPHDDLVRRLIEVTGQGDVAKVLVDS